MNKRRDRVEKWRKEQKMKLEAGGKQKGSDDEGKPRKAWSLEDDDDDDDGKL